MEASTQHWLPLAEYALRSGMSISTLRRKIKSNTISYKMEDGRYLIRGDDLLESARSMGFASSDQTVPKVPSSRPSVDLAPAPEATISRPTLAPAPREVVSEDSHALREELRRLQEDNILRWKALEARVSGIAKKLEFFSEQMAEAKMLVKLFEEKLDHRA